MDNSTAEKIKDIRNRCRLAMNGMVSQAMRERGVNYKLNFGVEYPRLKEIAAIYGKDHDLAQTLWKEDIREFKILAAMIQPLDTFCKEIAEIWMDSIKQQEIAEMTVMNLFAKLPYASELAFEWIAIARNEYKQYSGYLILARLLAAGMQMNSRSADEFIDQAETDAISELLLPRTGAVTALKKFVAQSPENAVRMKEAIARYKDSDKPYEKNMYDEITAEIEFSL